MTKAPHGRGLSHGGAGVNKTWACHAPATLDLACDFRAQYVFLSHLGQTALVYPY